ncbi:BnaA09g43660D [Brassica napus]|uniref:(rape) hypothetical protein n=1 Tax=Brassica napus TaxID=3708 RepID=A0A078FLR8_BRANA|nr:unnamed protein product [Brassica napus]CDY13864.1 BnaA09g43660D [Brassica napus]
MAKWSAIVLIMMTVIAIAVTAEAKYDINVWLKCFRKCSQPCKPHDGNCFERCKIQCGGPNPPHGSPRTLHGMTFAEVREKKER